MPPRYFIGLELPRDACNAISVVQDNLYDDKLLLKPLLPHVTIVQPNALQAISPMWLLPKLKPLVNSYFPLNIKIGELSVFNNSVLHFKIKSPELISLQFEIIDLLPPDILSRYYVGKNPYTPHVTIAQTNPKLSLNQIQISAYAKELKGLVNNQYIISSPSKFDHTSPRQYKVTKI